MSKVASKVKIVNGSYRNEIVNGTFPLIYPFKQTKKNAFVTVQYSSEYPKARISVKPEDFQYVNGAGEPAELCTAQYDDIDEDDVVSNAEKEYRETETEDEAMSRIRRSFEILEEMTQAAQDGDIRALIISGPAGIGKSFGVEEVLRRNEMMKKIVGDSEKSEIIKGAARPLALYRKLYAHRDRDHVLVFDDCDTILFDEESLNILKAALDTTARRTVSWLAESNVLREEDIPNSFHFNGSVIFLTNLDFNNIRSKKLMPHLKALKSRCLYMDLEISSNEDMLLRIRQVMKDGLLSSFEFSEQTEQEVYDFVAENLEDLQELSLRTLLKVAGFRKANEASWQEYSVNMVMTKAARYRWLLNEKKKRIAEAELEEARQRGK